MSHDADLAALLSLEGRQALVTGGAGGIGAVTASLLARAGADVVCVDRPGCEGPEGTTTVPCDLADPEAVTALAADIPARWPHLDVLVHAAGITADGVVWKMGDEAWSSVLEVNLGAAFRLVRGAVPHLRARQHGSIVLVSSINGERGKFGQSNYAASKAGLIGFARSVAKETGRFGVRVNVVAPGLILTPMIAALPESFREKAIEESALGRVGRPEDVAHAILYLCSDLSAHVTGQVLRVDGGQLTA